VKQRKQPGYYPGYSTLGQKAYWDATTRTEIETRVYNVPKIRFFTDEQLPIITAVCDRIVPQDDRLPDWRIPIVNYIDERLYKNEINGYRYEDMPPDREAHRLGLRAIDQTARELHGRGFAELTTLQQDLILKSLHDGEKLGAHDIWQRMSIDRYWQLLVGDCVTAYYSHPWAWDEIGYGGPAYPRAYMRLEGGMPEPWEVDERRYEWKAPPDSTSDRYEKTGAAEGSHHGQAGTH
jgi:Gluconate 2-dehydrogenase subunit 3